MPCFLALALAFGLATCSDGPYRVVDGDTFELGSGEKIRIADVDTAEMRCRCPEECRLAAEAKRFTTAALARGPVVITRLKTDRYGRTVATVTIDGTDLGAELIRAGLGRPYHGEKRRSWCQ